MHVSSMLNKLTSFLRVSNSLLNWLILSLGYDLLLGVEASLRKCIIFLLARLCDPIYISNE